MSVTELKDPRTGATVRISFGQLRQECGVCGADMRGGHIASVGEGKPWACLTHLETLLSRVQTAAGAEAPRTTHVRNETLYSGGNFYDEALRGACARADRDGMALAQVVDAGDGYVVAVFVGLDGGE